MEENAVKEKNEYEMVEMVAVEHLSEHVQKPDIAWVNLNFRAKDKVILSDCWGKVNAGQVCAVMGPSGSGKSSLLNVLAGRSAPAPGIFIEGRITVGGKLINPVSFRKNIAYVMQDDAMTPTATPREALLFSASMRLPASYSNSKIRTLVEQLLEELGIAGCADVMIGGAMIKGISGGQRKRTSVGVELVTDPSLLFLDEPTSGLDSYSAFQLVSLLKKVARRDCTVLCTIHQPSSEVFFLFDSVIFMKDGKIFYQGPCKAVINHFEQFAYHCPHNYNPSDFIMTLCQTIPDSEAIAKGIYMTAPEELSQLAHARSSRLDSEVIFQTERSLFRQICELTKREAVTTSRDTAALIGRFGVSMFLYFLFGLIFLGVGGKDYADTSALNNHFGGITELLIGSMFGTAQPIMLSFPFERPTFMREYSTGTCESFSPVVACLLILCANRRRAGLLHLQAHRRSPHGPHPADRRVSVWILHAGPAGQIHLHRVGWLGAGHVLEQCCAVHRLFGHRCQAGF